MIPPKRSLSIFDQCPRGKEAWLEALLDAHDAAWLQKVERTPMAAKIYIVVSGGVVQNVITSDTDVEVELIDYDNLESEGVAKGDIFEYVESCKLDGCQNDWYDPVSPEEIEERLADVKANPDAYR